MPYELFVSLSSSGISISPGELGENITTYGIDLHSLSCGTYLYFGDDDDGAVVQITGLRNPGKGVESYKDGLLQYLKWKDPKSGKTVRRCGVMGVVIKDGTVEGDDVIRVDPPADFVPLWPV
jgi:MOSC domain-containing protein YiiM